MTARADPFDESGERRRVVGRLPPLADGGSGQAERTRQRIPGLRGGSGSHADQTEGGAGLPAEVRQIQPQDLENHGQPDSRLSS